MHPRFHVSVVSPSRRRFTKRPYLRNVSNPQPGFKRGEINLYHVDNCCDSWIDVVRIRGSRVIRLRTERRFTEFGDEKTIDYPYGIMLEFLYAPESGRLAKLRCYDDENPEKPKRISCELLRKQIDASEFKVPPRNY